jgi:hypothetical protein
MSAAYSIAEKCKFFRESHAESRFERQRKDGMSVQTQWHQILLGDNRSRRISRGFQLLSKDLSGSVYPKSAVRDAFHTLSHHSNIKDNMDRFAQLNKYHVSIFSYLLDKLKKDRGRRWFVVGSLHGSLRKRDERWKSAQSWAASDHSGRQCVRKVERRSSSSHGCRHYHVELTGVDVQHHGYSYG